MTGMNDAQRDRISWPELTLRLMRAHFFVFGVLLLIAALALSYNLYTLEFERIDISSRLRITRPGDIYAQDMQLQVIGVLLLAGTSLFQFQVMYHLAQRRRSGLWLARISAAMLLVGFPIGIMLWILSAATDTTEAGLVRRTLVDLALGVRIVAGVLVFQSALAVWYAIASLLRPLCRACSAGDILTNPLLRRAQGIGVVLWLMIMLGLGVTLGVMTDWLYELRVPRPAPGELLYATSFDDLNDEWDLYPGRDAAEIVYAGDLAFESAGAWAAWLDGDALLLTHGVPLSDNVIYSTLDRKFNDFDLRVTARLVAGPPDEAQFGVVFRYRDDANFYMFLIAADGWYSLQRVKDGVRSKISEWGMSNIVQQNDTPNELRVVAHDDEFRFFLNG
ncbi:MAG: hypothetical protein K8S97_10715, partial [Anaerolineae bacterium]|nr:hypothetical protein [Anaerolineae bacterium]